MSTPILDIAKCVKVADAIVVAAEGFHPNNAELAYAFFIVAAAIGKEGPHLRPAFDVSRGVKP